MYAASVSPMTASYSLRADDLRFKSCGIEREERGRA
jgi:hypothetical protein